LERLLKKVTELHEKVRQYGDEISQLLGISPDVSDPRSGCFGMIFNHLTLTLELLHYYYSIWGRLRVKVSPEKREGLRQENAERCITILSWLFIACLSSIEYSAKSCLASYAVGSPVKKLAKVKVGQRVYISSIVNNSKAHNLIDDDEYDDWQNLILVRNCLVHNNAVSDTDKILDIGGTRLVASAGKMFQGKLDCYAVLTEVAIERYFSWVKTILREYGK